MDKNVVGAVQSRANVKECYKREDLLASRKRRRRIFSRTSHVELYVTPRFVTCVTHVWSFFIFYRVSSVPRPVAMS